MKNSVLLLIFIFSVQVLSAQEYGVRIRIADAPDKLYSIEDIQEMAFIKSDNWLFFCVYLNNEEKLRMHEIRFIKNFYFLSDEIMINFVGAGGSVTYKLALIDSIVISSEPSDQEIVIIGSQKWMKRNLDVTRYRNGDSIRFVENEADWSDANNKKEGAWCYYRFDPLNGIIYGKLYNWFAVNDPRGLAPEGWRIPGEADWDQLAGFLGGESQAGGKLKTVGDNKTGDGLWNYPNTISTNSSGFTALPGGFIMHVGGFIHLGNVGYWWSANLFYADKAYMRFTGNNDHSLHKNNFQKGAGFSVRCLKDD